MAERCDWPGCTDETLYEPGRSMRAHKRKHWNPRVDCPEPDCSSSLLEENLKRHLQTVHKADHQLVIPEVNIETVLELRQQLAERDEKIASMGRTADKRNSRIKSLEKRVAALESKQ
jgi:hypothetical protein